ncbi:FecR domain-containing protein [Aquipseudomonas alcaligenes]|uniref:FecR family protein n=1 Tax=Aquipseudomonas alcaligenes TaxID=43263 RepID=A0A1N6SUE8_AQUAC|nr:FecR domain-containing protein [Pseudomonas alcaligenes]SIQ44719.1 FecR family protein [Pseudomonas alcaligenes]
MGQSIDFAVLQQAADWFARLRDEHASEQDRLAWQHWLEARPQHRQAWLRVESISGQFERLPQRQAARSALQARGVERRQALKALSIVAGVGLLGLGGRALPWQQWQASQRTAVGEVRDSQLADGSRLWLNTDSALDVDFTAQLRRLTLYRGEVLVDAADDARPLWLETAHARLRVQGGRFAVRQLDDGYLVSTQVGALEILGVRRQSLVAGQQAYFDAHWVDSPVPLRQGQQAWTHGILQADDMPLGEFVAELSRHQRGHLGCDPRVANLRLVGAFPLAQPARIYAALEASLPVRVVHRLPWWISIEPRHSAAT